MPQAQPTGATAQIPPYLHGEIVAYATVDAADLPWLSAYRWLYHANGSGYARTRRGRETLFMHRMILGLPPRRENPLEADHLNRDGLDNRRCNLRAVTRAQNNQNRPAHRNAASSSRGVSWDTRAGKWLAFAKLNGKQTNLGMFSSESEAACAASDWRAKYMPYSTDDGRHQLAC